ncbi:hypothetical protein WJX74_007072 [Apatococcus lobatus]|uniref:Uncharacterized protein n=1 Tax=Apatococcus lobatus TaxID=904363 RepID=A0AAW1Q8M1_9CHLO
MTLDSVVTRASLTGPLIAAVSQAAASTSEDFDGLIYGTFRQHLQRSLGDERDDDEEVHQEFSIAGFHCNAFCGSFYSGTGSLDRQVLQDLTAQLPHQLLGWFVCRRGSWAQPSMREQQVSAALLAMLPPAGGCAHALFMLFTPSQHHEGATLTLEQRLYHCSSERTLKA